MTKQELMTKQEFAKRRGMIVRQIISRFAQSCGVETVPTRQPTNCTQPGCNGKVGVVHAVLFVAQFSGPPECGIAGRMGLAWPCSEPGCKKLHEQDGTPMKDGENNVFLGPGGIGIVVNSQEETVNRFWTSEALHMQQTWF